MSISYLTESEAPRDFRVSSIESDSHYTKCVLCYTVKRNFYCPDCIRNGNFVHSSMPYSDRYADKLSKLLRLKANRRHALERCEKLLLPRTRRDALLTETKQAQDQVQLLKLAIQQRKDNIEEKRKELRQLTQANNELRVKLPRYQKRVSSLEKHAASQRTELANKISTYTDQANALAALRRSRIRQLTKYVFPVYLTYDASDSMEELEFVVCASPPSSPPAPRTQLHVRGAWLHVQPHYTQLPDDVSAIKEGASPVSDRSARVCAALGLAAQLTALIGATLDCPAPHPPPLSDYYTSTSPRQLWSLHRRLSACCSALAARARLQQRGLLALSAVCDAAASDDAGLGRVEGWLSDSTLALASWDEEAAVEDDTNDPEPPEHLHWPEPQELKEEMSSSPPNPIPSSLVTSAAASIVSMWRGWTK